MARFEPRDQLHQHEGQNWTLGNFDFAQNHFCPEKDEVAEPGLERTSDHSIHFKLLFTNNNIKHAGTDLELPMQQFLTSLVTDGFP